MFRTPYRKDGNKAKNSQDGLTLRTEEKKTHFLRTVGARSFFTLDSEYPLSSLLLTAPRVGQYLNYL